MKAPRVFLLPLLVLAGLLAGCADRKPSPKRRAAVAAPQVVVPPANPADVGTVEALVRASYEVLSGPANQPRDWDRDRSLYLPSANLVSMWDEAGTAHGRFLTPEQFRAEFRAGPGLEEYEVGRRVEFFGNIAQVRSVAEIRQPPGGPVTARSVNYFHLTWDGTRWWIAGLVWQRESPESPIPEAWIDAWENVNE